MVLLTEMEKEQVGEEIKRSTLRCTGQASQVALVVKNLPASAGDVRDVSSIPGLGRFPWRRAWQSTPVFLPGNPKDRGAWWATVHRVAKSQTRLKQLRTHTWASEFGIKS